MLSWETRSSITRMQRERAWVEVNVGAIAHNVRQIKAFLKPETDLMTVVKADAYGHGAVTVAKAALDAGATWLGVATIPEGIELREADIEAPILVLGATNLPEQVRTIVRWNLSPTLCTPKQAMVFSETMAESGMLPVHLKIDTGMSRLGTRWTEAIELVELVKRLPNLKIASIYSHFATADDPDPTIMNEQHRRFEAVLKNCRIPDSIPRHFANSAATLSDPMFQYNLVRTGLITYGVYPAAHLRDRIDLIPALQVKARITQVKRIPAGTGVSYGHRFISDREMTIAVVGIGYADGVPRNLSNQMEVLIRGKRVRQIGSVTMDQIMLDVTELPDVQEGEVVTVLGCDRSLSIHGESISADDWAEKLGTISWEILCGFKHRLPRVIIGRSASVEELDAVGEFREGLTPHPS
jgi:alanine racemase